MSHLHPSLDRQLRLEQYLFESCPTRAQQHCIKFRYISILACGNVATTGPVKADPSQPRAPPSHTVSSRVTYMLLHLISVRTRSTDSDQDSLRIALENCLAHRQQQPPRPCEAASVRKLHAVWRRRPAHDRTCAFACWTALCMMRRSQLHSTHCGFPDPVVQDRVLSS